MLLRESSERHEKLEQEHASLEVEFTRVSRKLENSLQSLSKVWLSFSLTLVFD